jgi:hypothetical protein
MYNSTKYNDISDLIDKEKGKTAIVCGLGPSLKKYLKLVENNELGHQIISCNDVDVMTNIKPNYWVFANSAESSINYMHDRINSLGECNIVYADSVDPLDRKTVDHLLERSYYGYDQRHFSGIPCTSDRSYPCCKNIIEGRKTIQEILMNYTGYDKHYGGGDTVALHMVSLSVLLGCDKIYITGCDLNMKNGYVNNDVLSDHNKGYLLNYDDFEDYQERIQSDFNIINESAKKIGTRIYSLVDDSIINNVFEKTDNID